MRHLLANVALYAIATFLVVGAALFAWMRTSQLVLTDERTMLAHHAPADAREFEWRELGRRTYYGNCAACHGDDGEGWDEYPPLAGTAALLLAPGGREYLVDVHLHGLASPRWGAPMPPMGHLPDVALAAVMNHVLVGIDDAPRAAPGARLYLPADVAARRGPRRSPHEVNARRPFP